MKRCSRCKEHKPASAFRRRSKSVDGLQHYCKDCANASRLRWQRAHGSDHGARTRDWRLRNLDKVRSYTAARRARLRSAATGDPELNASYEGILRASRCEQCGAGSDIQVDHIDPLCRGGAHDWENFAGLCQSCNARKHDKTLLHSMLEA